VFLIDSVQISLETSQGKAGECYGSVSVNRTGVMKAVCGGGWDDNDSNVVCKELGCGRAISTAGSARGGGGGGSPSRGGTSDRQGTLDKVKCDGSEASLWHCLAKSMTGTAQCSGRAAAYVVCEGMANYMVTSVSCFTQ